MVSDREVLLPRILISTASFHQEILMRNPCDLARNEEQSRYRFYLHMQKQLQLQALLFSDIYSTSFTLQFSGFIFSCLHVFVS